MPLDSSCLPAVTRLCAWRVRWEKNDQNFAGSGDIRRYLRHPAAADFTAVARTMAAVADAVCRLLAVARALAILPLFGLPGIGIHMGGFQRRQPDRANGALNSHAGRDGGGAGEQRRAGARRQ